MFESAVERPTWSDTVWEFLFMTLFGSSCSWYYFATAVILFTSKNSCVPTRSLQRAAGWCGACHVTFFFFICDVIKGLDLLFRRHIRLWCYFCYFTEKEVGFAISSWSSVIWGEFFFESDIAIERRGCYWPGCLWRGWRQGHGTWQWYGWKLRGRRASAVVVDRVKEGIMKWHHGRWLTI